MFENFHKKSPPSEKTTPSAMVSMTTTTRLQSTTSVSAPSSPRLKLPPLKIPSPAPSRPESARCSGVSSRTLGAGANAGAATAGFIPKESSSTKTEPPFYFQVFSDLHIEKVKKGQYYKIEPYADYLFLAGDIGNVYVNILHFIQFFNYCSKHWKHVFYICGNCEFYHYAHAETYKKFFEEKKYTNVHFLHSSYVEIPDTNYIVYGATLWTPLRTVVADNKYIPNYMIQKWSAQEREKLRDFLNVPRAIDKHIIVMTHFPPMRQKTSAPKFDNQPPEMKAYYSWDIYDLLGGISQKRLHNISAWICGHTHYSYTYNLCGMLNAVIISNPVGYLSDGEKTDFREDAVYYIYSSPTENAAGAAAATTPFSTRKENIYL